MSESEPSIPANPKAPNTKRVLVDLPEELVTYLERAARANNSSMATELQRSIATNKYFDDHEAAGAKLLLETRDGKFLKVTRR